MLFLGHVSHYWTSIMLFVPVVGFMVWLAVTQFRDRRAAAREAKAPADHER